MGQPDSGLAGDTIEVREFSAGVRQTIVSPRRFLSHRG